MFEIISAKKAFEQSQVHRAELIENEKSLINQMILDASEKGYFAVNISQSKLYPETESELCCKGFELMRLSGIDGIIIRWDLA